MNVTIVGTQFGDEGKGGTVDRWAGAADAVVRYQGGDNAGHTVVREEESENDDGEYKLSLVPSGVLRGTTGVLGNGCVINPKVLFSEIDELRERGVDPDLRIAARAHVILPYHCVLDGIEEDQKGELAAGTTGNGIGPTYEDKAARRGVRIADLRHPDVLRERLEYVVPRKRALLGDAGIDPGEEEIPEGAFDVEALFERYRSYGERLVEESMVVDAGVFLEERIENGGSLLFEGAQGTGIDIDYGTYPSVTSSNPSAGGVPTGTGLSPNAVADGEVVGIVKAYLTRVGTGPMPTELGFVDGQTAKGEGAPEQSALATRLRDAGGEYGTVTGRPRRIGWLDLPILRHASRVNGLSGLVVNHVDTLAELEEIKVAERYELDGEERTTVPASTERWRDCEPQYRRFEGWPDADWERVASEGYGALPEPARAYLEYLSEELGVAIYAVGVGPERSRTVTIENPFE